MLVIFGCVEKASADWHVDLLHIVIVNVIALCLQSKKSCYVSWVSRPLNPHQRLDFYGSRLISFTVVIALSWRCWNTTRFNYNNVYRPRSLTA